MLKYLIVLAFLLPQICLAQNSITGKIINGSDKKPVTDASVFLNNATNGTKTDDNGAFTLGQVKNGQYDLVVSCIGFETYHQTVTINNADLKLPAIELTVKTMLLKEVNIRPDPNRWRNYDAFKRDFLGSSENASQCKILNPDAVYVSFDAQKMVLSANSDEFIEIENKALGYKIKYLLNTFTKDNRAGFLYFVGSVLFEPLKGSKSQQRRWEKARLQAYLGSSEHFLKSCIRNNFEDQNFKVFRLIRSPNKLRLPDSIINPKIAFFRKNAGTDSKAADSLRYWAEKARAPKIIDALVTTPLKLPDFMLRTDKKGMYALSFKDCLYINYTKKDHAETTVTFAEQYAFFDTNGVIANPNSTINEGYWGRLRTADLLPVDYEPPAKP